MNNETVRNQDVKGVFNIGSGEATSINKLAGMVQRNSGRGFVVVYSSPRPGDVLHSYANISKAKKAWGYKPKIRLEKGILDLMRAHSL